MSSPRRLLETAEGVPNELRKALLGAPGTPKPAELQALTASLSSALGVALTTPVAPAVLSAKAASIPGASASKGLWAIGSWLLGGATIGVGMCAVALYCAALLEQPKPKPAASTRSLPSAAPGLPQPSPIVPQASPIVPQPESTSSSAPLAWLQPVLVPLHRAPDAGASDGSDLGDPRETEISLLQRAQQAVARNPSEALSLSEQHAQEFPNGVFVQEREVIAIDSLLRLGRVGEARARAQAFMSHYSGSAHARRVQALVEEHSR